MSKVITFSRKFPVGHPSAGKPTYFVEQILNMMNVEYQSPGYLEELQKLNSKSLSQGALTTGILKDFINSLDMDQDNRKTHTVRAGNRWKAGDCFSPRVWSGRPYTSPQIIIGPDIKIPRITKIIITKEGVVYLGEQIVCNLNNKQHLSTLGIARRDGLSEEDFIAWFFGEALEGQVVFMINTISGY
jgi:hypothetical protein